MPLVGSFVMPHPPLAVPGVGMGEEAAIPATLRAYDEASRQIAALKPDTVVIVSPHAMTYYDAFRIGGGERWKTNFEMFRAPEAEVDFVSDLELAEHMAEAGREAGYMTLLEDAGEGETQDHGSFVPLYFIKRHLGKEVKLVRMSFSALDHETHVDYGRAMGRAFDQEEKRIVFVASGDLSHRLRTTGPYGLNRKAPPFEEDVLGYLALGELDKFAELDPDLCEDVGECGIRSICILAGIMEGREFVPRLLSHEEPFGVGYAIASFLPPSACGTEVTLARLALEKYVRREEKFKIEEFKPALELKDRRAGAFVSLHLKADEGKEGELRGCIGTIRASCDNLAEEIIAMAAEAGTEDPRFEPLTVEELPNLTYNVDVLGDAEPAEGLRDLDPVRYGVIVSNGMRRGLLLPDLPGVHTAAEQVAIALQKAGIEQDEPFELQRFEVTRFPDRVELDEHTVFAAKAED